MKEKKGNLRVSEPQIQRNRDGSPVIVNGHQVMQKNTTTTFIDNKTGAVSTIQIKSKNNNIKKVN